MEEVERRIDPKEGLIAFQQFVSQEVSRLYFEISMRDAYIKQLEEYIDKIEEERQAPQVEPDYPGVNHGSK